jgi:hypothetical protein
VIVVLSEIHGIVLRRGRGWGQRRRQQRGDSSSIRTRDSFFFGETLYTRVTCGLVVRVGLARDACFVGMDLVRLVFGVDDALHRCIRMTNTSCVAFNPTTRMGEQRASAQIVFEPIFSKPGGWGPQAPSHLRCQDPRPLSTLVSWKWTYVNLRLAKGTKQLVEIEDERTHDKGNMTAAGEDVGGFEFLFDM